MGNMIPFDSPNLPAHLRAFADISSDDLSAGVGGGYPVVSIKGKVFHIVRADEKTLVTKPGSEDGEPAPSIEVVILKANPAQSKVYYSSGYVEGSTEKPTCYSNDGIAPAADAQERQSTKCAVCPHNQWGAKITEQGKKAKACADSRRLAVAPIGQINDPMLLRVPAASLTALAEYGNMLKKRGVKYPMVSTRIGFDYTVAHPALTFKPVGILSEDLMRQVVEAMNSDIVKQIIGSSDFGHEAAAAQQLPAPAPVAQPAPVMQQPAPVVANAQPAPAPQAAKPAKEKKPATKPATNKLVEISDADLEAQMAAVLKAASLDD